MTWTRRKHSDLLRLLAEFAREHPSGTKEWWDQFRSVELGIAAERPGPKDEVISLGWWCILAEVHYGLQRHAALRWLVQQYYDRESIELFRKRWGRGTVDSIARRLYQKHKNKWLSREHIPTPKFEHHPAWCALRNETAHLRWLEITEEQWTSGNEPPPLPPWDWESELYRLTFEILPTTAAFKGCFPKSGSRVENGKR